MGGRKQPFLRSMKLIVNADDFGLTRGVNLGIIEAFQQGIVRSTTIMAGMDAAEHAAKLAKQNPELKVGLHFRLTTGKPLAKNVSSLLDDNNDNFQPQAQFWDSRDMKPDEIERELKAQIEACSNLGITLSHLDSHHHCHSHELVQPIVRKVADEFNLPLRPCKQPVRYNKNTLTFTDVFYGDKLTTQNILDLIAEHQDQTDYLEIMSHPALVDEALLQSSGYALPRTRELAILTDPGLITELKNKGITVTDYAELTHS